MQRVQPGHEVLSLFGIASQPQALSKETSSRSLTVSLISAFFIILAVGLTLGLATRILGPTQPSIAATTTVGEQVAFTPGQFVSDEVSRGYLSVR